MQIEIKGQHVKFTVWAIGIAFSAFFLMNKLHIENHEFEAADDNFKTRLLMSESTRYAEVAKYYRDEMKARDLTEAEWARLELVEKQQCRIRNILADKAPELCD